MKIERIEVWTADIYVKSDDRYHPDKKVVECHFHTEKEATIWAEQKIKEFSIAYADKAVIAEVWQNTFPALYEERYFI